LFNSICEILYNDNDIKLHDIVIVAPNIDEYKVYINAVFSNEYIDVSDNVLKVPYTICGLKDNADTQLLDCILCILKLDYKLKVKSIFELLNQTKLMQILDINVENVNLIYVWLKDNNIHFGIDAKDYSPFGYDELDLFTFKRLLNNLVLGSTIPNAVLVGQSDQLFNCFAYDNLEFTQIELCNKLIKLVTFLEHFRQCFYKDEYTYKSISISMIINFLTKFSEDFLTNNSDIQSINQLVTSFNLVKLTHNIDLSIVITMLTNFYKKNDEMLYTSGKLTFTSMKSIKNIPYKVIYVLGMNYGEFPRLHNKNRLSILHISGAFADINANIEDKQLFLDIILSAQKYLYFSYIGRSDSDNSVLNPSVILNLLITVLKNSIANDGYIDRHVIKVHHLHPYLNKEPQHSKFWAGIANGDKTKNLHWDFSNNCQIKPQNTDNTSEAINQSYVLNTLEVKLDQLNKTFYYSNTNLYNELDIKEYNTVDELSDDEMISITNKNDTNKLISELEALYNLGSANYEATNVYRHLYNKGLLAYGELGLIQFDNLYSKFIEYKKLMQKNEIALEYYNEKYNVKINGDLLLNENNEVIILQDFKYFIKEKSKSTKANEINYYLKIKALISLLLLADENSKLTSRFDTIVDNVARDVIHINVNQSFSSIAQLVSGVDKTTLLENVILIYKNSLVKPTLIDKGIIESFSKDYKKIISNTIDVNKIMLSKLSDEIKGDRIFYNNLDDYLNYTSINDNSILQIALLLSNLDIKSLLLNKPIDAG
ncbi:MAG: exodeoxyribonuclease V subunit gamma, partial [Burkholderiales bacterium]|nr:exodeoxyribonuclease V subunit gamma [Burkholderiales bacterium]